MTVNLVKQVIVGGIAFIVIGLALNFGPSMLTGFEAMRTADNVSQYTGLTTVIGMGPTLILLGFIVAVAIAGFMGIRMMGKRG